MHRIILPLLFVTTMLLVPASAPALAQTPAPAWHNDPDTCRSLTAAVLRGQANNATDALMPTDAPDALRRDVHGLALRLVDAAAAVTQHRTPKLERVLPDRQLGSIPVSIEIWSFGDQEVYLIGCGIRPATGMALVSIQAYPTLTEVMDHLGQELRRTDDPPAQP